MGVELAVAAIAAIAMLIATAVKAGQNDKAMAIRQQVAARYGDINLPAIDEVTAQKLPPDAAERYVTATQSSQAQSDVLARYMDTVGAQGETAEDRAAYLRAEQMAGGVEGAGRGATLRALANRGLAGSGLATAMMMQGAQDAANRANEAGVTEAAQARMRYMDALRGASETSGRLRGQELEALRSQDAINMFNARQQSDADYRNSMKKQREFDNRMELEAAKANAELGVATAYNRAAEDAAQTGAGIANAGITAASAIARNRDDEDEWGT